MPAKTAYGAVSYIKTTIKGQSNISFVMGKVRIAPVKPIPRLELTAAVLEAKLSDFIKVEIDMKIDQFYFWTDSQVVLRYLRNTSSRFKTFVANRIETIQDITNVEDWYYVPTHINPADKASRGIQPNDHQALQDWIEGPHFLRQETYPSFEDKDKVEEVLNDSEIRHVMQAEIKEHDFSYFLHYFSSFQQLLKSTIWLSRFILFLINKRKDQVALLPGRVSLEKCSEQK